MMHGIDSTANQAFSRRIGHEVETNTMRHHNSVFHDLLKHVPWAVFDRLVDEHHADHRIRRMSTKDQFIAMLYGQLSGSVSLREIVEGLGSHQNRLYHLGSRPVQRSTLADANAKRASAVFTGLFAHLSAQVGRGLRRKIADATYLIDATGIQLSGLGSQWAHFSSKACGAKAHVVYDAHGDYPVYAQVTAANVNDITPAKAMPIEAGATYVFDLGYYDYSWWARLDQAGCRIVTRFKKNTRLKETAVLKVPEDSDVLSDRIGLLPPRGLHGKHEMTDPVREVQVETPSGQVLRIMSNDLDSSAQDIADLYKRRWAIELFFKWIKKTLRIRHCVGRSENALRIQIAVALIAFLLLRLAQQAQTAIKSPLAFARIIRANLMHRKRIDRLLEPDPTPMLQQNQMTLL
jgi:hypothetical protein